MAVLALATVQQADDYRKYPIEDHGKLRFQHFNMAAVAVAGDAGSTIDLCDLPPGRVRVLPHLSRITNSAWGAARVLDIGLRAYQSRDAGAADPEAEAANVLANDLDVSAAAAAQAFSDVLKYDLYSKAGIKAFATVAGGTIPVGATLSGCIAYIYE